MAVKFNSSGGGSVLLDAPSTASNLTVTLPSASGTLVTTDSALPQVISVNSTSDALRITQTGSGNALLVEDSANPDSTPFVVTGGGYVVQGNTEPLSSFLTGLNPVQQQHGITSATAASLNANWQNSSTSSASLYLFKSRSATIGTYSALSSGDNVGVLAAAGDGGSGPIPLASIKLDVDTGTVSTTSMPGRLVFSTTADGASSLTERMRINSDGSVAIGVASSGTFGLRIGRNATGATSFNGQLIQQVIQSDVTSRYTGFYSLPSTAASAFTLAQLEHFRTDGVTIGAGSSVTNQYGFHASSALTGATNNYGFYSNIASGTGRWNFYASGTAANYMAGTLQTGSTIGVGGATPATTGAGITFPATQSASSDANTLDDYEEGTWTPSLVASGYTFTFANQVGHYTKIGNAVFFKLYFTATYSSGSGSVDAVISGLPFTSSGSASSYGGCSWYPDSGSNFFSRVGVVRTKPSATQMTIGNGWNGSSLSQTLNWATLPTGFEFEISGHYFV